MKNITFAISRNENYQFVPKNGAIARVPADYPFRGSATVVKLATGRTFFHRNSSWEDGPIGKMEDAGESSEVGGVATGLLNEAVMAGFNLRASPDATATEPDNLVWTAWKSGVRFGLQSAGIWWKHEGLLTYRLEAFCLGLAGLPVLQRPWGVEAPDAEAHAIGVALQKRGDSEN